MRRALLAAIGLVTIALAGAVPAHAAAPEVQVKAAYLYKLASFVRWPDDVTSRSAFRFCVAGRNDVAGVLRKLARGQQIAGMPVEIHTIDAEQANSAAACNILFLGRGPQTARDLSDATQGRPVLTVADRNGGTDGGVIDFVLRDGKVRFVIDQDLARGRGLELSSKLLDVALAVER